MNKIELIKYLNDFLKNKLYSDSSKNGLQVDSQNHEIKKIWYAVDATSYIFEKAIIEWVDMLLTHHWIYWWREEVLVWIPYKRVKALIDNNICLYSSHLPLDANREVWNNIWLLKAFVNMFWLQKDEYKIEKVWEYDWNNIWYWLKFDKKVHISNIVMPFAEQMQLIKRLFNFWNKTYINSIAFISGWWWSVIWEISEKNYDLLVTWETVHHEMILAKELSLSILVWWHYETEKIWPKLLALHLKKKFGIETVYLDEKY